MDGESYIAPSYIGDCDLKNPSIRGVDRGGGVGHHERRLWGDRLVILPSDEYGDRRVVGSVIFHGYPTGGPHGRGLPAGIAEVGYGIEAQYQRLGLATEATQAAVHWALAQDGVEAVQAVTFTLNKTSRRVLEKIGMRIIGSDEHDFLGELLVYELRRGAAPAATPPR